MFDNMMAYFCPYINKRYNVMKNYFLYPLLDNAKIRSLPIKFLKGGVVQFTIAIIIIDSFEGVVYVGLRKPALQYV